MKTGLAYDDVLVVPQRSPVNSRSNVNTQTMLTESVSIDIPIISAPMDTVTEVDMAEAMDNIGGIGFLHRYMDIDEQSDMIERIDASVVGTIGIDEPAAENASRLYESGATAVCIDVAHAHLEKCLHAVSEVSNNHPEIPLIVGNVATGDAAADLIKNGANAIKVGIGPGSHCLTREVAGVGVPQVTAVRQVAQRVQDIENMEGRNIPVIADGGIQKSGDIVKALVAGADSVMIGGLLSGCKESPAPMVEISGEKYKKTRGMASEEAREEREQEVPEDQRAVEGAELYTEYSGTVEDVIEPMLKGVRSGISYAGGTNIKEAQENGELIRVTANTQQRNGIHGSHVNGVRDE